MIDSPVSSGKKQSLIRRMAALGIREEDIREQFILGSGKGGQKINKTSSCVRLMHRPSGASVKCAQGRSREFNRFMARRRLCDVIEERMIGEESERRKKAEKVRRQKHRRSRRQKEKMLEEKRRQSRKKQMRGRVARDDEE